MVEMKSLACPQCGSPDLEELAWNKRRCQHCGAYSSLSDDRTSLEIIEWQCPKCGFNNERDARHCGQCGNPLVKTCPACQAEMRWDLAYCPNCGSNYAEVVAQIEAERRRQEELERRLEQQEAAERRRQEELERRLEQQEAAKAKRRRTARYIIIVLALTAVVLCYLIGRYGV